VSSGPIVVGGEALVDLVPGQTDALMAHPGGGPYNTARTIGRLEQPVAYLGRISTDRFGTRLRNELVADGVSLDAVVDTDDPTTLALAEIDPAGGASYRFYADGTSVPGLTTAVLPDAPSMLHVGSLGLVFEPTAATLEGLVEERSGAALVAIDVNCRPLAIDDPDTYRARIDRMLAHCHLLKASDDDLAYLEPKRSPVDAARALLALGPRVALVTRGGEGSIVVTPDAEIAVPAVEVDVVDTIGAGDAYGGAFLAWWRRRGLGMDDLGEVETVVEATRFASLVAAKTCERAGAVPPRLPEVDPTPYH
jgi:fructokinase